MTLANFYFRNTYYSTYLPISKMLYYYIMNLLGFTYVNVVTLRYERYNPFADIHDNSLASFFKLAFIVAPILSFATAIVVLRGENDRSAYLLLES